MNNRERVTWDQQTWELTVAWGLPLWSMSHHQELKLALLIQPKLSPAQVQLGLGYRWPSLAACVLPCFGICLRVRGGKTVEIPSPAPQNIRSEGSLASCLLHSAQGAPLPDPYTGPDSFTLSSAIWEDMHSAGIERMSFSPQPLNDRDSGGKRPKSLLHPVLGPRQMLSLTSWPVILLQICLTVTISEGTLQRAGLGYWVVLPGGKILTSETNIHFCSYI